MQTNPDQPRSGSGKNKLWIQILRLWCSTHLLLSDLEDGLAQPLLLGHIRHCEAMIAAADHPARQVRDRQASERRSDRRLRIQRFAARLRLRLAAPLMIGSAVVPAAQQDRHLLVEPVVQLQLHQIAVLARCGTASGRKLAGTGGAIAL